MGASRPLEVLDQLQQTPGLLELQKEGKLRPMLEAAGAL